MNLSVVVVFLSLLSWTPEGEFSGGDLSPTASTIALINDGEFGLLNLSSGTWTPEVIPGEVTPPVKFHNNGNLVAFTIRNEQGYAPVIFDLTRSTYDTGPYGSEIRSLSWDKTQTRLIVGLQNSSALIPCSLYVLNYNPAESLPELFITTGNIFPGRDAYFLPDGNIICLAGNHFPPLHSRGVKPYKFRTGYAFVLTKAGDLVNKIELFDDPSIWDFNSNGQAIYAAGNKIYYIEISSNRKEKEILLSLQTSLVSGNLTSAIQVLVARNYYYVIWDIGSVKCLGSYNIDLPEEEIIITCGVTRFSSNENNQTVAVLSGDAERGLYSPRGNFTLSFTNGPASDYVTDYYESETIFALSITCNTINELFSYLEILDKVSFSFLSPSVSTGYQVRIFRINILGVTEYLINFGSFSSIEDAQDYLEEVQGQITLPVELVEE